MGRIQAGMNSLYCHSGNSVENNYSSSFSLFWTLCKSKHCSQVTKASRGEQCLQLTIFQIKRHLRGQRFKFIYRLQIYSYTFIYMKNWFYNTISAVEKNLTLVQYNISKHAKSILNCTNKQVTTSQT